MKTRAVRGNKPELMEAAILESLRLGPRGFNCILANVYGSGNEIGTLIDSMVRRKKIRKIPNKTSGVIYALK